jgi:hypothetical protein
MFPQDLLPLSKTEVVQANAMYRRHWGDKCEDWHTEFEDLFDGQNFEDDDNGLEWYFTQCYWHIRGMRLGLESVYIDQEEIDEKWCANMHFAIEDYFRYITYKELSEAFQ